MFNPYHLVEFLNTSSNPFFEPMKEVDIRWGIQLHKNLFIFDNGGGTCKITGPLTFIDMKSNNFLISILSLQKELEVGKFDFRSNLEKGLIEVYYEAIFSKDLATNEDELNDFLISVFNDVEVIKEFDKQLAKEDIHPDDVDLDEEEEELFNLDGFNSLVDELHNNLNKNKKEDNESEDTDNGV